MNLKRAIEILRHGQLVAFPTETVYGLGADATSSTAVGKIFAAKGRPSTNPLIVHVADAAIARRYARSWPQAAAKLAEQFWPGPLTLVVPKSGAIVDEVSAGLDTVGLRSPNHPIALELLRAFDGPIAAPSANRSNRISPTTAEHVRRELGDSVDLILDGGPCHVGIESTVLDLTRSVPLILRPGAITRLQIEQTIGPVEEFAGSVKETEAAPSPGQQAVHYSPRAPAYRFDAGEFDRVLEWQNKNPGTKTILLLIESPETLSDVEARFDRIVAMPSDPDAYARRLYAALHDADGPDVKAIFIELPLSTPQWTAVRDRLLRATRPLHDAF